ncbi:MAG: hypothetical protein RLZZ369_2375, partial [Pseudomonadota bacterium]
MGEGDSSLGFGPQFALMGFGVFLDVTRHEAADV